MSYQPPIQDMVFAIRELAGWSGLQSLPAFAEVGDDTLEAVLEEAARLSAEVIAPLDRVGDQFPSVLRDGQVHTPPGFKAAFQAFVAGGWQGMAHPVGLGGQGLPKVLAAACSEMLNGASLSFALCPLLTDSAIEALLTAGTPEQQALYVPALIRGDWTGTMNLTEPDAGSDLSRVRTRAEPQADGSYRLFGQKIYITYGDHDLAENILHMVLARTPHASEGVKGLSLFMVPKWLRHETKLVRNDVYCASLEHKLGIKASPTAVMLYGTGMHPLAANDGAPVSAGAVGWRMGEEGQGLELMFIMMNAARFAVGLQGVAVAEHAYQKARAYARTRVQGSVPGQGTRAAVPILAHPDVRRMLMTMRVLTEGSRALAYVVAAACDRGRAVGVEEWARHAAFYDFLVPVVKGLSTEMSLEVTSLGLQIHGGMGFIEETGAAQLYRDARILTIYEGTTAIQANDFLGRKTLRDGGARARDWVAQVAADLDGLACPTPVVHDMREKVRGALGLLSEAIDQIVRQGSSDLREAYAGSVPYLMLFGTVLVGWQWVCAAQRAAVLTSTPGGESDFCKAKQASARFYIDHILPRTLVHHQVITHGAPSTLALADPLF